MRCWFIVALVIGLVACDKPSPNTLVVGTIAGPETELVQAAKKVALKQYGLSVKIVEFNDYNLPNEALQEGSLDANVFQHLPYLQAAIKAHGYTIEPLGKTFIYPAGIYSIKYKAVSEVPDQAIIAIPNDPSNEARALQLLQTAGLIKVSEGATTLRDVQENPKNLKLKELDAAQLPRVLVDVDAAVINTNYAIPAGLSPSRHSILLEDKQSPYANLVVIKTDSKKRKALEQFMKAMNSEEVRKKAQFIFSDAAIPAW